MSVEASPVKSPNPTQFFSGRRNQASRRIGPFSPQQTRILAASLVKSHLVSAASVSIVSRCLYWARESDGRGHHSGHKLHVKLGARWKSVRASEDFPWRIYRSKVHTGGQCMPREDKPDPSCFV